MHGDEVTRSFVSCKSPFVSLSQPQDWLLNDIITDINAHTHHVRTLSHTAAFTHTGNLVIMVPSCSFARDCVLSTETNALFTPTSHHAAHQLRSNEPLMAARPHVQCVEIKPVKFLLMGASVQSSRESDLGFRGNTRTEAES